MKPLLAAILAPVAAILLLAGAAVLVLRSASDAGTDAPRTQPASPVEPRTSPTIPAAGDVCQGVAKMPDPGQPRRFSPEYTTITEAAGITIVANRDVSPRAVEAAKRTVERFFASNDLEQALAADGAYVIIAASGQGVLDLPEFRCLAETGSRDFFDHVCGVADRADYPVVTVNEDDLLGRRSGPCGGLNILYHELGHLVMGWAIPPADYFDIRQLYASAMAAGKYRGDYAATNAEEYFAEGTQAYFLHSDLRGRRDRDWLRSYDPDLYALLARIYGE
ncbi:hypothetical protein [Tepidiforma thermophila]|uniref:Uncharacterized protein n=1 Tax=Tepidiforma thermophila (strain KCTC 52669 / CGMCC 1.13589 / G233) TaxID=2761530 RepID=A0A2A9HD84_TEPT2|nr:hypothetical protein [Tepidiforma thermophila]PFG73944.1 hypothetical protein A9A59_1150 [Tepidiforma thermophila]